MSIGILFPIFVTILGVAYILTIDRITDLIPGIGWIDTPIALAIIVGAWFLYFAYPILIMLIYFVVGIAIIVGLVYALIWLYRRAYEKWLI